MNDPRAGSGRDQSVVRIREDTIRLGQFLKLADLVDTGSDAKGLLASGLVRVNGDVETRRGRQLVAEDVVEVAGRRVVVSTGSADG
jgi:ribosome-associated protein